MFFCCCVELPRRHLNARNIALDYNYLSFMSLQRIRVTRLLSNWLHIYLVTLFIFFLTFLFCLFIVNAILKWLRAVYSTGNRERLLMADLTFPMEPDGNKKPISTRQKMVVVNGPLYSSHKEKKTVQDRC